MEKELKSWFKAGKEGVTRARRGGDGSGYGFLWVDSLNLVENSKRPWCKAVRLQCRVYTVRISRQFTPLWKRLSRG